MTTSADMPRAAPRALAHPLPAGMRDLLPEEAGRRRALARRVLEHFALHGYQLVTPPVFELAEVLERGLGTLDPSDVLRFVEPESGEIAALRPDMTPQIARMVATRLLHEPKPIRLCYEGTIVRRRQGRARRHRQVPQAGVELYGVADHDDGGTTLAGDVEILRLAASVVRATGLCDFALDLGHAAIARALLEPLSRWGGPGTPPNPPSAAAEASDALEQKDGARIAAILRSEGGRVPAAVARALSALPDLHGGGEGDRPGEAVFDAASGLFEGTAAEAPLRELRALWEAARRSGDDLARALRVDLGEVRGFAYYTGAIFHLLAPGPGEPIGAGGRYDDLLGRFDAPMPAVGFALHLDAVAWARDAAGCSDAAAPSAVVAAGEDSERLVAALRAHGVPAVAHVSGSAFEYAHAWRYTHLVHHAGDAARVWISRVGPRGPLPIGEIDAHSPELIARAIDGKHA